MSLIEKEKQGLKAYIDGCTCSQSTALPYAKTMNIDEDMLYALMEGFGGGFGGEQEVCGCVSAMCAIISTLMSNRIKNGSSKFNTYQIIRKANQMFKDEFGSIRCIEILHGNKPVHGTCGLKIKKAIDIIDELLPTIKEEK